MNEQSTPTTTTQEPTGKKKLSELIREGCKRTTPIKGDYFEFNRSDGVVAACALGAAYVGAQGGAPTWWEGNYTDERRVLNFLKVEAVGVGENDPWPELKYPEVAIPAIMAADCDDDPEYWRGTFDLNTVVVRLNDDAGWTREGIADWLEEQGY